MSDPSPLVRVADVDYLDEDKPIRGQKFVCLSFLSPEEVLQNKECFIFTKYLAKFAEDVNALLDNLAKKYPDDAGLIATIRENHDFLSDAAKMQENYEFFKSVHGADAEAEFNERNNFQTSVRGIKVRGVFESLKEAQMRAELLKRLGDKFNIYVGEVGAWCPWSPNPEDLKEAEYAQTQLNTLMKKYKENMMLRDEHYEERKNAKIDAARKENEAKSRLTTVEEVADASSSVAEGLMEAATDPWLERKQEAEN
jgi:hypothetical protein